MTKTKSAPRHLLLAAALATPNLAVAHPDLAAFDATAFAVQPTTVDCSLENGAAASCYEIIVN